MQQTNIRARKRNRLQNYNYSSEGWYFVTICIKDKEEFFGKIDDGKMVLNEYGKIAQKCWLEIPDHFSDVETDEFIIMPNHIHGIVVINNTGNVGNGHARSLQSCQRQGQKLFVIIGTFKSAVSKNVHRKISENNFQWQKSFYDHIIRDEKSLENIREYIFNETVN